MKGPSNFVIKLLAISMLIVSCNQLRDAQPTNLPTMKKIVSESESNAQTTPTITPISVSQTELECARSKFDVAVVGSPAFCVVWMDNVENETGFRINLRYSDSEEMFVYEVGPHVTQLLVPEAHQPTDSQGNCIRNRQVFEASVIALLDSGNVQVGSVGGKGECWIITPTP